MADNVYRNTAYDVYVNLFSLARHRGLKVLSKVESEKIALGREEISVEAKNEKTGKATLFTRMPEHINETMKPAEIVKVCVRKMKAGSYKHHLFVLNIDMDDKKILAVRGGIEKEQPQSYVEIVTYDQMQFDMPEHDAYIKHEVVEYDDPNLELIQLSGGILPEIFTTDMGCVWAGARAGDVVRIYRADGSIAYRRVVSQKIV